jgi:hypothetical protein
MISFRLERKKALNNNQASNILITGDTLFNDI